MRVPASTSEEFTPELGRGETDALRLALESPSGGLTLILDDWRARETAGKLGLKFTGTLGVLLEAKRAGLLAEVKPHLDRLDALGFRVAVETRLAVLRLAGEGQ